MATEAEEGATMWMWSLHLKVWLQFIIAAISLIEASQKVFESSQKLWWWWFFPDHAQTPGDFSAPGEPQKAPVEVVPPCTEESSPSSTKAEERHRITAFETE